MNSKHFQRFAERDFLSHDKQQDQDLHPLRDWYESFQTDSQKWGSRRILELRQSLEALSMVPTVGLQKDLKSFYSVVAM